MVHSLLLALWISSSLVLQPAQAQTIIIGTPPALGPAVGTPPPPASVPASDFLAVLRGLQAQLSSAITTGTPINLQIPAGTFSVNQSLLVDLRTATRPVSVNITGQGPGSTILDCQGQQIVAILVKNASSTLLSGLTVQNCGGEVADLGGGGVYLETTGDITVTRCVFQGNGARQAQVYNGAAIRLNTPAYTNTLSSRIVIANSSFFNNAGVNGGGLYALGVTANLQITNCFFQGNNATNAGAGVYLATIAGSVQVDSCQFTENNATRIGGGLSYWTSTAPLVIRDTTFLANVAPGTAGALNLEDGTGQVTVINTRFFNGSSQYGGAFRDNSQGNVTFIGCSFRWNRVNDSGGAAAVESKPQGSILNFTLCNFTTNTAPPQAGPVDPYGGAVYIGVSSALHVFDRCNFVRNSAKYGAAFGAFAFPGSFVFKQCTFEGNNASESGGGLYYERCSGSKTVDSCVFTGNLAERGAAYFDYNSTGSLLITNSTFQRNNASLSGGGIRLENGLNNSALIRNSSFLANTASFGGAVNMISSNTNMTIQNSTLQANAASTDGGAINIQDSNMVFTVVDSTIQANTAKSGGGFNALRVGSNVSFVNTQFLGNQVSVQGGAARFDTQNGTVLFSRCLLDGNRALQSGGGLYVAPGTAVMTIQNTAIQNNVAAASSCAAAQSLNSAASTILLTTFLTNNGNQTAPDTDQCLPYTDGTRVSPPPPPPVSSQPPVQSPPPLINTPPTTTPPAAPSPSPSPQSKTGVIVGAVVGGVAGVGLLAGLVAFFLVRKRRGRRDDVTVSTVAAPPKDTTGTSVVVIGVDGSPNSAPAKSGTPGNSQSPRSDAAAAIVLSDTYTTKTAQGSHVSVYGGQSLTSSGSKQLQKTFSADKSRGQYETRALSSMSGAAPSSMDSYAVYQREMLYRLKIPWASFKLGRVVGKGGFGVVYQGKWQASDVAVKTFDNVSAESRQDLHREALAMCELRHPYIAHIYGVVDDGPHCALVMKYYKGGTVSALIAKPEYYEVPLSYRLKLALQVATGMSQLHERNIVHGDLKTSNLLIDRDGRNFTSVITDFGLSVFAGETLTSAAFTVHISPPEVLRDPRAPRTQAGDVYAFGIVLLEIVTGRTAYAGLSRDMIRKSVLEGKRPPIPASVPADICDLIQSCWAEDPRARPSFSDIVVVLEREENEALVLDGEAAHDGTDTTTSMAFTTMPWPCKD